MSKALSHASSFNISDSVGRSWGPSAAAQRGLCRPWPCNSRWAGKRGTCCHERRMHVIGVDLALSLPQKSKERVSKALFHWVLDCAFLGNFDTEMQEGQVFDVLPWDWSLVHHVLLYIFHELGQVFLSSPQALGACFYISSYQIIGDMCLSVQLYCKWLGRPGTLNWNSCPP